MMAGCGDGEPDRLGIDVHMTIVNNHTWGSFTVRSRERVGATFIHVVRAGLHNAPLEFRHLLNDNVFVIQDHRSGRVIPFEDIVPAIVPRLYIRCTVVQAQE